MKPKDLKFPFKENSRSILVTDRIWFIPETRLEMQPFVFNGWHDPQFFGNRQPLSVEYCSGNGTWIASKALAHPERNWIAVERQFSRVKKIWSKIKNLELPNLFVVCGEGFKWTKTYLGDASVAEVYVNFPDPWPKRRHAVHRIVQTSFVEEMKRVLAPSGLMTLVTDDQAYSAQMIDVAQKNTHFSSCLPPPYFTHEFSNYGTSFFDDLWRKKGKHIYYHMFKRNGFQHV